MKKRPERKWAGPCLASQLARRAASSSKASSSDSGSLEVVEESEAVVVAESVVPDIEDPFVYLEKDGEIG